MSHFVKEMRKRNIEKERKERISKYNKNVVSKIKDIVKDVQLMFDLIEDKKFIHAQKNGDFSIAIEEEREEDMWAAYYYVTAYLPLFNEIIKFARLRESNRKGSIETSFKISNETKSLIKLTDGVIYIEGIEGYLIKFNKLRESIENGVFQNMLSVLIEDYDNLPEEEKRKERASVLSHKGIGLGMGHQHQQQCLWARGLGKSNAAFLQALGSLRG